MSNSLVNGEDFCQRPVHSPDQPRLTLVLGGARSGKSRHAEACVTRQPAPWVYVATAEALDPEMRERIAHHQARRGEGWTTVETPLALVEAIKAQRGAVLVDCLTLWLSNLMREGKDVAREEVRLLATLKNAPSPIVLVSNEVGLGIVPDNRLARDFRDAQGRLNQRVAEIADHVVFMAAGLPLILKSASGGPRTHDR
jgi:adenosylcobinamide kinase / adenosylcobinamide-phosphate guanylyltransferase